MSNPYDTTGHGAGWYQQHPLIPPPPPDWTPEKRRRPWLLFVLIAVTAIATIAAAIMGGFYWISHQSKTPPAIDANYTATDILSDFGKGGCPCGYGVAYGTSVLNWSDGNYPVSIQAASSATWPDPGQTAGSADVGLWVYSNPKDAQSAYAQVGNDEMSPSSTWPEYMKPTQYLHGRCLLLITGYSSTKAPWSGYQQALDKYCI